MNILVLTFGNRMLEDYYLSCLSKILDDGENYIKHLDILSLEHTAHIRKFEYDKSSSLALRLKGLSPASDVVVADLSKVVKSQNVDVILCLNAEVLWYIDALYKNYDMGIPVICALSDCNVSKEYLNLVSKFLVLTSEDKKIFLELGVTDDKISVCGLIGSRNFIPKFDARKEISMYFEDDVCILVTDGEDFDKIASIFDEIVDSHFENMNFIVICKRNRSFCDVFNARYEKCSNIGAIFARKDINLYISSADYVIIDSDLEDVMSAIIGNKPLIVVEDDMLSNDVKKFIDERCLAIVKSRQDIVLGLNKLITNNALREYMLFSQREMTNNDSDNIIKSDIINKIYIKKGNENEQQSSS